MPKAKGVPVNKNIDRLLKLGDAALQAGNLDKAVRVWQQALNKAQGSYSIRINLGLALKKTGRIKEAIRLLTAVSTEPDVPAELLSNLSSLLNADGNCYSLALDNADKAIMKKPHLAAAYANKSIALLSLNRPQEAINASKECLSLNPLCAEAHTTWGAALHNLRDFSGAARHARRAIKLGENIATAYSNLGIALIALNQAQEALQYLEHCVSLDPDFAKGHVNLGIGYFRNNILEKAISSYRTAIKLDRNISEAHSNLGIALQEVGDHEGAIRHFCIALNLDPDYAEAHFGHGTCSLSQQQWNIGWQHYGWRFQIPDHEMTVIPEQLPRGTQQSVHSEAHLLIIHEQGLGDSLQFCRHLPALAQRCGRLQFAVPSKLHNLLNRADLQAELLPFPAEPHLSADAWLPLLDLPALLESDLEADQAPYLHADPERCSHWQQQLRIPGQRLIGLCWQGNPEQEVIPGRSLALENFAPLAEIPGVKLLSLQRGAGEEQLQTCSFADRFVPQQSELNAIWDFAEITALMHACDRIVTVDTAVAHLAGGLGRPTSLLLKHVPDWRWGLEGTSTPLYPSMRLYRQPSRGDWRSVINALVYDLREP